MATRVKICGLRTAPAVEAVVAAGADYVGLNFYPPSPRSVTPDAAKPLADVARGRARIVALVVDADDAVLHRIVESISPDILQLHGSETPARVADIRGRFGRPVMKVIGVSTAEDARMAFDYVGGCEMFLFDAKAPKGTAGSLPGGNGLTFDWHALEPVMGKLDFMLAGGLTAENVATAIRLVRPAAVDVSSGVERAPGEKDPELVRAFISAARST
jgi:phosphoribosylanthranilate isomerase